METLQELQQMGLTLPTPAYLAGMLLFGLIGMAAFYFGRRTKRPVVKWLGVALMLYPYMVSDTTLLYIVGAGLTGACYYYRNQ